MKRKHVVLYEDGDVEVLRLERERWELIDGGRKSVKKARPSMNSKGPLKELSPGQKSMSVGGLRQNKSSVKMVQRKRTPKRHLKHVQKSALKRNADNEETADVLKSKSIAATKNHKMSSDESEGEHTEKVDKNLRDREESEKEVGSVSQERYSEDWKESPNHGEESNEVKSDADANLSEEKAGDELVSDASREKDPTSASKESAQIGSKSRISKELPEGSTPSSVAGDGISDDEPLWKWKRKRKVGKSSYKKRVQ